MTVKKFTLAAVMTVGLLTAGIGSGFCEEVNSTDIAQATGAACPVKSMPASDCATCQDLSMEAGSSSSNCPHMGTTACASDANSNYETKQIYAYPNAIYGENNIVGSSSNGVYIGDNPGVMQDKGILVTDSAQVTGAAASMDSTSTIDGIKVDRTPAMKSNPISIETQTSMNIVKRSMVPIENPTGGAAPVMNFFEDVPAGFWASCDINDLAGDSVVVGYPDRLFRPNKHISRAEFASMIVNGYNLKSDEEAPQNKFKDVPKSHWANRAINEGVKAGLISGYSNDTFKPQNPVSRIEALTMLSKGITCEMDNAKADEVLKKFSDGDKVPTWAKLPVAKALDAGALNDSPDPSRIMPSKDASRAEISAMLEQMRVSMGYAKKDIAGCAGDTRKVFAEEKEVINVPTLQLTFNDQINSRFSNVGDIFTATTIDSVTINGVSFPAGSVVSGKILEVVRPTKSTQGALKLAFSSIKNGDMKSDLPKQVLTAQVNKSHQPNGLIRLIEWPFDWAGSIVGTASRTVGGAAIALGNAAEGFTQSIGTALGETTQGQFKAAGRSFYDSGRTLVKAPVDLTRTAVSGTMGLFQTTADELTYLVDPKGMKVSSINPKERVTIAFGCND